jgi:hypothetical protein
MKKLFVLTPFAVAALAGCAPAANQIQHGQWELVQEVQSMTAANAPEEVRDQMRSRTGRPESGRLCLTEDQARRFLEFTKQAVTQGQAAACTFSDEVYAGGTLRQNASCPIGATPGAPAAGPARGNLTSVLNGRFTGTTFNATVVTTGPNIIAPGGGDMNVTVVLRGRRLGDCPAGAATPTPQPATNL